MNSRSKEPTRVLARVLARRSYTVVAATPLSIEGVVAGVAVEEIQARSKSASTLEEQQQAEVSLNFEEFEATTTTTKTTVAVGLQGKGYSVAPCI